MSRRDNNPRNFQFGPLTVGVQGLGVYFGGEFLTRNVAALPADQLQSVNKEAWKQKRAAIRAQNKFANVSFYGELPYDEAVLHEMVCESVCKATWKRMNEVAA